MEELLKSLIGKNIDINAGTGSIFNGELKTVTREIAVIENSDGQTVHIVISAIRSVAEINVTQSRPGFIV